MADVIYGFTPEMVEALRVAGPVVRGIILGNGIVLSPGRSANQKGDGHTAAETLGVGDFEDWLVEKWRREIRSEGFRKTAEYEYLRAEWERTG